MCRKRRRLSRLEYRAMESWRKGIVCTCSCSMIGYKRICLWRLTNYSRKLRNQKYWIFGTFPVAPVTSFYLHYLTSSFFSFCNVLMSLLSLRFEVFKLLLLVPFSEHLLRYVVSQPPFLILVVQKVVQTLLVVFWMIYFEATAQTYFLMEYWKVLVA